MVWFGLGWGWIEVGLRLVWGRVGVGLGLGRVGSLGLGHWGLGMGQGWDGVGLHNPFAPILSLINIQVGANITSE